MVKAIATVLVQTAIHKDKVKFFEETEKKWVTNETGWFDDIVIVVVYLDQVHTMLSSFKCFVDDNMGSDLINLKLQDGNLPQIEDANLFL